MQCTLYIELDTPGKFSSMVHELPCEIVFIVCVYVLVVA